MVSIIEKLLIINNFNFTLIAHAHVMLANIFADSGEIEMQQTLMAANPN